MRVNGKMTFNTAKVSKLGLTNQDMKVTMHSVVNTESALINGTTSRGTQEIGVKTKSAGSEFIFYAWLDGRRYEGEWLDNNMEGMGIYIWNDGRKYQGQYKDDKKHGFGIYTWADGREF